MFSSKVFIFFCFSQDLCAIDALRAEISVQTPPKKEKKGKPGTALNVKLNLSLPVPNMSALEGCECRVWDILCGVDGDSLHKQAVNEKLNE